jgi:hypothetical protein
MCTHNNSLLTNQNKMIKRMKSLRDKHEEQRIAEEQSKEEERVQRAKRVKEGRKINNNKTKQK